MALLPSFRNNRGFTLLEVLIAVVIMTVGMLGLLQSVNLAMQYNLANQQRDEAVTIGQRYMKEMRDADFTGSLPPTFANISVSSKMHAFSKKYYVARSVVPIGSGAYQLQAVVTWTYRNNSYRNEVVSIKSP